MKDAFIPDLAYLPFRIRIGVTGHRALPGAKQIAARIREIFNTRVWELFDRPIAFKERTVSLSFTVLTCLAEGADRLVAQEALNSSDAVIEAVLPLMAEEYSRDFVSPESKREFAWLLEQASQVIEMELPRADGSGEERKAAYENAGRHVVDHCDLLIAVWDGKSSRGRGGTAEIAAYAREKNVPLIIVSSLNDHEIAVEKGPGLNSQAYRRLGIFNSFTLAGEVQETYVENVSRDLFDNPEGERLDGEVKERIRSGLLSWYVRASMIAKKNQKSYFRAGLLVYSLSPLAVAAVAIAILIPGMASLAFVSEFLLLASILVILLSSDKQKTHKKWIEARFLAERIRSAIFLSACGSKPSSFIHFSNLKPLLEAGEWTVRAFDEIMGRMNPSPSGQEAGCAVTIDFVRRHWLQEQIEFHASKATQSFTASRRLERAGWLVFLAAIFAAAWHLVGIFLGHPEILAWLDKPVLFLAIVLPALGATLGGIRGHREFSRLAKRSQYMQAALRELDSRLATADPGKMPDLLHETEQLLLQETQEWLVLMKFAKVEAI
jgi:hypothetical protein